LVFFLSALALMPQMASAQSNLLTNPGFETGTMSGWGASSGTYSAVTGFAHSGTYAAKINAGSTVAQTVTGLTPNTTYTCTGWLEAPTAGQTIYMGVQNFGGTTISKGTNTTTYTQLSVTFTTGPASTSATLFIYNDTDVDTAHYVAYCDDLTLTLGPPNLLLNPGFETGTTADWTAGYGSYSVGTGNAHSGTYAAQVNQYSTLGQTVTGLTPNTTYTCTGWLKVAVAGQDVYLGAQNYGSGSASKLANATSYTQLSITFTTGPTNTSAEIFIYQNGASPGYADDLSLMTGASSGTGDATGTQANRIADCLQRFGVNTFSRLNNNGYPWSWGGSQGSYDSATTGRAINYITGGSGLTINDREYHHDGSSTPITPLQITWMHQVYQETGSPFTIAIGAGGTANDIPGLVTITQDSVNNGLNYAKWIEGINEPNTNFGSGTIPVATTSSVQASLYSQIHAVTSNVPVEEPSVVFGLPSPASYLNTYLGSYKAAITANSDQSNIHLYPSYSPNSAYTSSVNGIMADVDAAFDSVFPGLPKINTEFHPTLYAKTHQNDHTYDAYWGPIALLSSYVDYDWQATFWFALFDYNSATMQCGLFTTSDASPRPAANAYRALFQLTGDQGVNKSSFTPGKLNVTVTGLPPAPTGAPYAGGRWALFENSSSQYFLIIWNEQNTISAVTTPVTVTFNSHPMTKVVEYNITSGGGTPVQSLTNVTSMTVNLDTSVRVLQVTY